MDIYLICRHMQEVMTPAWFCGRGSVMLMPLMDCCKVYTCRAGMFWSDHLRAHWWCFFGFFYCLPHFIVSSVKVVWLSLICSRILFEGSLCDSSRCDLQDRKKIEYWNRNYQIKQSQTEKSDWKGKNEKSCMENVFELKLQLSFRRKPNINPHI